VPSPFREGITRSRHEALDVLGTLEDARLQLENLLTWTTLLVELIERELLLSGRLLNGGG
jgi:hypothetical protein